MAPVVGPFAFGLLCPPNARDHLALGPKLRILTVVDTHPRLCPVLDARFSDHAKDVVQTLEKVGYPKTIRVDNGAEFVSGVSIWGLRQ